MVKLPDAPAAMQSPGVVEAYRKRLETAGRLDTPEGTHVVMLAEMWAAGGHTASGAASLSRELRAALAEALKDAPRADDAFDELAKRRAERAAGA